MTLKNDVELKNTREKLVEIQARYDQLQMDTAENPRVRRVTLISLKRLINQLTEEIARYTSHQPAGH